MQISLENIPGIILVGSVVPLFFVLWGVFKMTNRIALWVIVRVSRNIPNYFKGLF